MSSAAPQDHRWGPPCALPGNLVAMATGRQPPQVQRVGACRVQGDITLDHCGCLCCAFLPHLKGSGPPGAQVGKCPAGAGSGGRRMLPCGRTGKGAVEGCHCKFSLSSWWIRGTHGMWSTEIEELSSKSKPVIHLSGQSSPVTVFPRPLHGKGFILEAINIRVMSQHLPLP